MLDLAYVSVAALSVSGCSYLVLHTCGSRAPDTTSSSQYILQPLRQRGDSVQEWAAPPLGSVAQVLAEADKVCVGADESWGVTMSHGDDGESWE